MSPEWLTKCGFRHLGDTEGFLAATEIMLDSGDGIVVMTNSNDAAPVLVAVQGAISRLSG